MQRQEASKASRSNTGTDSSFTCAGDLRVAAEELNKGIRASEPFSSGPLRSVKTLRIAQHDLSEEDVELLSNSALKIDTETDGLDFRRDKLRLVQIADVRGNIVMVRNPDHKSVVLRKFLTGYQLKIFHHAPFDIRFIYWWTGAKMQFDTIHCTKILSKMVRPKDSSSLHKVIPEVLGEHPYKEKSTTLSNWNLKKLTAEQITYACTDVVFLDDLSYRMQSKVTKEGRNLDYLDACAAASLAAFVDVEGNGDCLTYDGQPNVKFRQLWTKRKKIINEQR